VEKNRRRVIGAGRLPTGNRAETEKVLSVEGRGEWENRRWGGVGVGGGGLAGESKFATVEVAGDFKKAAMGARRGGRGKDEMVRRKRGGR